MEDEEAQKMVALKKAYADIILNTAKEAAAKIMVSERKALRFQHDLCASRDEALRMLLRLKQMLDSKTMEAELNSLSQQRRINELEAQLHEAENVISDLRVELRKTEDELENVKRNQVQAMDEKVATFTEKFAPFASSWSETTEASDVKTTPLNQRLTNDKCYGMVKQTEGLTGSDLSKSDIASLILRSKKPELYRNGCTQRIRAFERNMLNGELPPEYEEDGNFPMENEACCLSKSSIIEMDKSLSQEELKKPSKVRTFRRRKTRFGKAKTLRRCHHGQPRSGSLDCKPSPLNGNDKSDDGERTLPPIEATDADLTRASDGMQENLQHDNQGEFKIFRKGKRRRSIRSRNDEGTLTSSGQLAKPCQPSPVLSRCRTFVYLVDGGIKSIKDHPKTCENNAELILIKRDSDSLPVSADIQSVNKPEPVWDDADKGVESVLDGGVLVKQGSSDVADDSRLSGSESNGEMSKQLNESSFKEENNRLLKYTFQRKRKREAISSPDDIASPEKISVMRTAGKEHTAPESQKSSSMDESSRDSRRLAQVARQLISLSGRRW